MALTTTYIYAVVCNGSVPFTSDCACCLLYKRSALLRSEEIRSETYSYMAGIFKNLQCHPIKIDGADDHVHILSSLSKNIAFADLIGRVKGSSSKRLSEGVLGIAWQNGYGAFSVSESSVEAVTAYISDQAEHHGKFSYQEELRELLKRHRVPGLKPMGYSVFALRATQNVQTCRQDDSQQVSAYGVYPGLSYLDPSVVRRTVPNGTKNAQ